MKKILSIILIIILSFSIVACSKTENTNRDIVTKIAKEDFKFKPEIGKDFDTDSAWDITNGASLLAIVYRDYIDKSENFSKDMGMIKAEIELLKTSKEINANNSTEKEVYNKIEYALKTIVDLGKQIDKLEEMKNNQKMNIGNVTDVDIKKQEETLKKYEKEVEVAFETVLGFFEIK